jgi:asparagine synthase (glutamine-hydrolysing)
MVESVLACMDGTDKLNILLSGGIDSSVIASAASELTHDVHSVCVGMADSEDLRMAEKVAELLRTRHKERVYSLDDMLKVLDKVVYYTENFDFPTIRASIPNYIATQMFRDRSRITLLGECGDEIFAGYEYLRELRDDQALRAERSSLLASAYLTKLQRVDRMTACASLDGRLPMMNQTVIEFGLSLGWKELLGPKGDQRELALRKAFEAGLPKEVFSRRKRKFGDSAVTVKALVGHAASAVTDAEFEKERKALPGDRIRTKEELLYFRLFRKHFPGESALASIGSLDPRGFPRKTI